MALLRFVAFVMTYNYLAVACLHAEWPSGQLDCKLHEGQAISVLFTYVSPVRNGAGGTGQEIKPFLNLLKRPGTVKRVAEKFFVSKRHSTKSKQP